MPEYPDIENYADLLRDTVVGQTLHRIVIDHPFLLRTVQPGVDDFRGVKVAGISTLAKRIVIECGAELFAVVHLMIAGRLSWREGVTAVEAAPARSRRGKTTLARFAFETGVLELTEAGSKRRASLHLVQGRAALATYHPGGADPFTLDAESFFELTQRANRTLKRFLTDQTVLIGIGNAYSDEILFEAQMSPLARTHSLDRDGARLLLDATTKTLADWRTRLREQWNGEWPRKVTAFLPDMAVHGKFGEPCPRCATPIQRIRYAENECDYCPTCQTEGVVYKDRVLSRLLKDEWPRTVEELESFSGPR